MTLMNTSEKGINLIKKFEGCKLYAYRDSVGVLTIGYGTTKGVKAGMAITQKQAEDFLKRDIVPFEKALNSMNINFTQGQYDALISFQYNLGTGAFKGSTMYRKIVARASDTDITDQMVKWVNSSGKPLLGLKKRRVEEANMFLGREVYYVDNVGNIKKR